MATEKRLIDASALDGKLEALVQKYTAQRRHEVAKDYSFVQTVLLSAPTVEAVEVVRCKDCASGKGSTYKVCPLYRDGLMKDDDYCSYGERKDNAGT